MTSHPDKWEIYIPKDEFERLRSDSRFIPLLPLARVVNALKFCFQTLLEHGRSDTPAGTRQHINSFMFACGILYEGLKIANTLGKHYGGRQLVRAAASSGFARVD